MPAVASTGYPSPRKSMAFAKRMVLVGLTGFLLAVVFLGLFPLEAPRVFMNQRRTAESIRELNRAEYDYVHKVAVKAHQFTQLRPRR